LPSQVDGARVLERNEGDGLHINLDDGFLMFRESGTEPVLRIYAEARGPRLLARRLRSGARLLARHLRSLGPSS
jgi:phosphomannomutase